MPADLPRDLAPLVLVVARTAAPKTSLTNLFECLTHPVTRTQSSPEENVFLINVLRSISFGFGDFHVLN